MKTAFVFGWVAFIILGSAASGQQTEHTKTPIHQKTITLSTEYNCVHTLISFTLADLGYASIQIKSLTKYQDTEDADQAVIEFTADIKEKDKDHLIKGEAGLFIKNKLQYDTAGNGTGLAYECKILEGNGNALFHASVAQTDDVLVFYPPIIKEESEKKN